MIKPVIQAIAFKDAFYRTMATITARGGAADKVRQAVSENIGAVVSRWVVHGENGEVFTGKGKPHPALVALADKANKTALARAFRATTEHVAAHVAASGKPATQAAHDAIVADALEVFSSALAGKPRTSKSEAERSADALERAVKAIVDAASVLSAAQADAIRQALALADGVRDAQAQAAKATQAAPAETVTA